MRYIKNILFRTAAAALLLLLFSGPLCLASERAVIAFICSKDSEPFFQNCSGFKAFFDEKKATARFDKYTLEKNDPNAVLLAVKQNKPDLIFAVGPQALFVVKENINDIPIVFSMVLNPGPITPPVAAGVMLDASFDAKLQYVKLLLPEKKNIGIVYSPYSEFLFEDISRACADAQYTLVSRKIESKTEFPDVMNDIAARIDCFLIIPDADIYYDKLVERILRESLTSKFSVIGPSSAYVKAGALIAFECDYKDTGYQAGELAYDILNGQFNPDRRFVSPRKVKFSLNLVTAEKLGVKIPNEMIRQASKVYGR